MIFSKSIVRGLCLPTGAIVVCAIKLRKINLGLTKQSLVVFLEINYFLLCTYKPSKFGYYYYPCICKNVYYLYRGFLKQERKKLIVSF